MELMYVLIRVNGEMHMLRLGYGILAITLFSTGGISFGPDRKYLNPNQLVGSFYVIFT
jgi:hypothetical protein